MKHALDARNLAVPMYESDEAFDAYASALSLAALKLNQEQVARGIQKALEMFHDARDEHAARPDGLCRCGWQAPLVGLARGPKALRSVMAHIRAQKRRKRGKK